MTANDTDVLIVGAGPTGLVLALWLTRLGVRVRIIDVTAEPGTTSRALAVQARTLEFYNQIGIAEAVVEDGRKISAVQLWVAGKNVARVVFGDLGKGISPYSFIFIFPQDEHEKLLIEYLTASGVRVERRTQLLSFEDQSSSVRAQLRLPDGTLQTCEAAYIAGCDGAHSIVRETLNMGFPGGTYEHMFYVADVQASGEALDGEIQVAFDRTNFLVVFPLKGEGQARLVGAIRDDAKPDTLSWDDVGKRVIEWMRIDVQRVNWFSTYRVHHRVAGHFRAGRAFLAGDAAHIHSPVGGQGMNTGIGDAVNLAWKLAAVIGGRAGESILDTYEPERIAFARRLVATTDQAFIAVTDPGMLARTIRLDIVPLVLPALFQVTAARRFLFRTVSQTSIDYRPSTLSEGLAGRVHGGDRLPWVPSDGQPDNFTPLKTLDWQVHCYGEPSPNMQTLCAERRLPLHAFAWTAQAQSAGLERNAAYLVRPDGYVGVADPTANAAKFAAYLDARKIAPLTSN